LLHVVCGNVKQSLIALVIETAGASETSVNFYETTRHDNPEDSRHLHTRRRENKNFHKFFFFDEDTLIIE
jgi:hypothetical protein